MRNWKMDLDLVGLLVGVGMMCYPSCKENADRIFDKPELQMYYNKTKQELYQNIFFSGCLVSLIGVTYYLTKERK